MTTDSNLPPALGAAAAGAAAANDGPGAVFAMHTGSSVIPVPPAMLAVAMIPLAALAYVSLRLDLGLAVPICVGTVRSFVQLSILGLVLQPIFVWGTESWPLVILFVLVMVLLAAQETARRPGYGFRGMYAAVLGALLVNLALVSLFAFGVIIRPEPLWDPQYVIPICGMLLGNCITGSSLSLKAMLSGLVEQHREIELYLSFGATALEASSRLRREAVRMGAMPTLNTMAVIGIISIPGMMTGQILGGSPVMEAARYQILIMYLIAMCVFGIITVGVLIVTRVGFDASHMLRTERFVKKSKKASAAAALWRSMRNCCRACRGKGGDGEGRGTPLSATPPSEGETEALAKAGYGAAVPESSCTHPRGEVEITVLRRGESKHAAAPRLEIRGVGLSVPLSEGSGDGAPPLRRVLFRDLSASVSAGDIVAVRGPSGSGKTQLLRLVAGLSPCEGGGDIALEGGAPHALGRALGPADGTAWRREVRYVTQYKVDLPGTPRDFLRALSRMGSYSPRPPGPAGGALRTGSRRGASGLVPPSFPPPPTLYEMVESARSYVRSWGMDPSAALDREWSHLSGGEAQRVVVAAALASRPRVLLLDECTSALDADAKAAVERSVAEAADGEGIAVMWITHDEDQVERMGGSM